MRVAKSDIASAMEAAIELAMYKAKLPRLTEPELAAMTAIHTIALMLEIDDVADHTGRLLLDDAKTGKRAPETLQR